MEEKKDIFDRIMGLPVLRKFYPLYEKYKSVLLYIFFGGLTTVISVGSFMLFEYMGIDTLIANFLSWICAVLFAYVTNRIWVFSSRTTGTAALRELLSFFGGRVFTLGVEELLLLVFVQWLQLNSTWVKIAAQVIVLVLNYVISKILVFRKKA